MNMCKNLERKDAYIVKKKKNKNKKKGTVVVISLLRDAQGPKSWKFSSYCEHKKPCKDL